MEFKLDLKDLTSSVRKFQQEESFTDCILVTREGIPVEVHKVVLSPCTTLVSLLQTISCCRGQCDHQGVATVLLPDVSYHHLNLCLEVFYSGKLVCRTRKEQQAVRDILLGLLGVRDVLVLEPKDGWSDCVECAEHLPQGDLARHMVTEHVLGPARRDLAKVSRGDNARVECSYKQGRVCDLDTEVGRVSNGLFNYVGTRDPLSVVINHYKEVHLKGVLDHLSLEHGVSSPEILGLFNPTELRQGLEPGDARPGAESAGNSPALGWGSSQAEVDRFLRAGVSPASSESEDQVSAYSGGLSSLDDVGVNIDHHINGGTNPQPNKKPPAHKETMDNDISSRVLSTKPCPRKSTTQLPKSKSLKRKLPESEEKENNKECSKKSPVDQQPNRAQKQCRLCQKKVDQEKFKLHVTTHIYDRWGHVGEGKEGKYHCPKKNCAQALNDSKRLIGHLATKHGELEEKLAERNESLSDYEMLDERLPDSEQDMLLNLQTNDKADILARHDLPSDYFSKGQENLVSQLKGMEAATGSSSNSDDVLSRFRLRLEDDGNSHSPLLCGGENGPSVVLDNGEDDDFESVDNLLPPDDYDSDATEPFNMEQDRMEEVKDAT